MIAYYYPTRVLLLDDDKSFVEILSKNLTHPTFYVDTYTDTSKVKAILAQQNPANIKSQYIAVAIGELLDDEIMRSNISNILNQRSSVSIKEQISVLVIDHDMPQITGLELLRQTHNPNIFKILLTGQVDDKEVVAAFNDGLIDSYINKADLDLYGKLRWQIQKGIARYFSQLSYPIYHAISFNNSTQKTGLVDKHYMHFLTKILQNMNIVEYYLIDTQGSYLMIDASNNQHTMLVLNQENALAHLDILSTANIDKELMQEVTLCKKMLYSNKFNDETTFFVLEQRIPKSQSFMYKIFNEDILHLMR